MTLVSRKLVPRVSVAGLCREVDDGVPAFEGGPDRIEIGEIRTHRVDAGHVAPIKGGEHRTPFQALAHSRADQAAHAGDQYASAQGSLALSQAGLWMGFAAPGSPTPAEEG